MKTACDLPVRKTMCGSCPFRPGSPTAYLAEHLTESAVTQASRICHQTGANNAFHKRTGKTAHLCRGARDVQLTFMASMGVIAEETDEAWNEAGVRIGMKPTVVQDPE